MGRGVSYVNIYLEEGGFSVVGMIKVENFKVGRIWRN